MVMAMAPRRRSATFTGDDAKRQRGNALVAGLARGVFCVCLAVLALLLSRWADDYSVNQHAALTVSAQTGSCQTVTGVGATTCTYHSTVNGRTYDVPGPGHGSDGPTAVRVDPAHPDDLYRAQKHLWVMWLMMIPPALLGAFTLRGWWRTERQMAVG
ncbi:hypothetical protein [Streptomyces sp. NPDC056160]|uniref:hypothetical protein n=1 Tax=Streptomyces sp. NPDC056160 TaxID=3345731 RepID=UPI0035E1CF65